MSPNKLVAQHKKGRRLEKNREKLMQILMWTNFSKNMDTLQDLWNRAKEQWSMTQHWSLHLPSSPIWRFHEVKNQKSNIQRKNQYKSLLNLDKIKLTRQKVRIRQRDDRFESSAPWRPSPWRMQPPALKTNASGQYHLKTMRLCLCNNKSCKLQRNCKEIMKI